MYPDHPAVGVVPDPLSHAPHPGPAPHPRRVPHPGPVPVDRLPRPATHDEGGRGRFGPLLATGLLVLVFLAGLVVGQGGIASGGPVAAADPSPAVSHAPGGPRDAVPDNAPEDFGVFWEALRLVQDRYVDPTRLGDQNLTWGAIRGMVDALGDTGHTAFLTPDEVRAQSDQLTGRISGIGVMVDARSGVPLIISVFDGSPADAAGLRAGDLITSVDGRPTERSTVSEVIEEVRGEAGTTVTLGITHRDGSTAVVPIVRADIDVPQVTWAFVPGTKIADIRLAQFSQGVADAFRAALADAIDQGATSVVLDLRGDPGGLVDQAVAIASMFLPQGATVYRQHDRTAQETVIPALGDPIAPDLPLVVLTDYGSASSSEILAAALRDNDRAQVIGQRTFGTGTVLNLFPLSDGSAILLGIIEWLTPDGEGIFDVGISPDIEVALPAEGVPTAPSELAEQTRKEFRQSLDTQLQRAVKVLTSARPPSPPTAAPSLVPMPSSAP